MSSRYLCHYLPSYFRNEGETREPGFWTDTVKEGLAKAYKDSDQVNIVCKSRGMPQVIFLSYHSYLSFPSLLFICQQQSNSCFSILY